MAAYRTSPSFRFLRRTSAVAAAGTALVALGLVSSSAEAVGPWLTWSESTLASGNIDHVRPATGTPGTASPMPLAAWSRAQSVDSSDLGRVVAYATQIRIKGRDAARYGLTVMVGGRARVLATSGVAGRPDVSPDGTTVTYGRSNGSVVRYDVATRVTRTLCRSCTGIPASLGVPGRVGNVALSPDRRYVAVWGTSDGDAEAVSVWRTAGGRRVALRTSGLGEPDDTLAWTPNSRQVGFETIVEGTTTSSWRVLLLGINGAVTSTAVTSPGTTRLSGPMRLNGAWWFVRTAGYSPTTRVATLLRTTSLATRPAVVGTVRTWAGTGAPFTGRWSITRFGPTALP
jgi:hypothetical protein